MIQMVYTISEAEFSEAQKLWCSRELKKLPGRWLTQGVGVLFGGFIGGSFHYLPLWLVCSLGGSLFALILVGQWRRKAIRHYQYTISAERFNDIEVSIDESGYRDRKAGKSEGWIGWSDFTGWRESANVFILGRNLTFVTIPKRALTAAQQDDLRVTLNTRLGQTATK
jgi:hypothetical protein